MWESEDEDFTGSVTQVIEPGTITEESEANRKEEEQKRMDANVEAYEKKLSDFERMFLFISDELDFNQLSEMAEEVERHKEMGLKSSVRDGCDSEVRSSR